MRSITLFLTVQENFIWERATETKQAGRFDVSEPSESHRPLALWQLIIPAAYTTEL